jgi:2-polyprenyl-3-methyl-5-hydroxy-6-metoxy-1,4-benzoquinol methylase
VSERYRNVYEPGNLYGRVFSMLRRHSASTGVVLDLGCGYGPLAAVCAEAGYDYVGCDLATDGLEALEADGFETHLVDLGQADQLAPVLLEILAGRSLAALLALDIIEHLLRPDEVLAALHSLVAKAPGAVLLVSIPNVTHFDLAAKLLCGRFDVTPTGLLDETHVSLFSPARLERSFRAAGFAQIDAHDDVKEIGDQHFPEDLATLLPGSPVREFLLELRLDAEPNGLTYQFIRAYHADYADHADDAVRATTGAMRSSDAGLEPSARLSTEAGSPARPLLSAILSVAGTRSDSATAARSLRATLQSLADQRDRDLEVLLAGTPSELDAAQRCAAAELAAIPFTRSVELADGDADDGALGVEGLCVRDLCVVAAVARGSYFLALQPGAKVAPDLVARIKELARARPGAVLRVPPTEGELMPAERGAGAPQLVDYLCGLTEPLARFALPRSYVVDLAQGRRDALARSEPWPSVLRAMLLCGLETGPSPLDAPEPSVGDELDRARSRCGDPPVLVPASALACLVERAGANRHADAAPAATLYPEALEAELARARASARAELESSTSWRVTAPLRAGSRLIARRRPRR